MPREAAKVVVVSDSGFELALHGGCGGAAAFALVLDRVSSHMSRSAALRSFIYIYIYIYMYIHMCTYIYIYMFCMYMYKPIYIYIYIHIYIYIYVICAACTAENRRECAELPRRETHEERLETCAQCAYSIRYGNRGIFLTTTTMFPSDSIVCIYIYIYRERERETDRDISNCIVSVGVCM